MSINLKEEIHFIVDYSREFRGILFQDEEGGATKTMVTDLDCGPMDMEEAKKIFREDSLPDQIINIPLDNEFHHVRELCLGAVLATYRVAYVVDPGLASKHRELVCDASQNLFTIQSWLELRNINVL